MHFVSTLHFVIIRTLITYTATTEHLPRDDSFSPITLQNNTVDSSEVDGIVSNDTFTLNSTSDTGTGVSEFSGSQDFSNTLPSSSQAYPTQSSREATTMPSSTVAATLPSTAQRVSTPIGNPWLNTMLIRLY